MKAFLFATSKASPLPAVLSVMQRASILATLALAIATGCYSQAEPESNPQPAVNQSVSAHDLVGATYCELGQPGMICLSVSTPSPDGSGIIEYATTRDDCLETGTITGALTFLPSANQPSCIGGSSPAYRATAVFVDAGLDLTIDETQSTIELEQVQ